MLWVLVELFDENLGAPESPGRPHLGTANKNAPAEEKKRLKMEAEQQKKLEEEAKMRVATLCPL